MSLLLLFQGVDTNKTLSATNTNTSVVSLALARARRMAASSANSSSISASLFALRLKALEAGFGASAGMSCAFIRGRGFGTTVAATSTLTQALGLARHLQSALANTSDISAGTFSFITVLSAAISAVSGGFAPNVRVAMRPVVSIDLNSVHTPSMGRGRRLTSTSAATSSMIADLRRDRYVAFVAAMTNQAVLQSELLAAKPLSGANTNSSSIVTTLLRLKNMSAVIAQTSTTGAGLSALRPLSSEFSVTSGITAAGTTRIVDMLASSAATVTLTSTLDRNRGFVTEVHGDSGLVSTFERNRGFVSLLGTSNNTQGLLGRDLASLQAVHQTFASITPHLGRARLLQSTSENISANALAEFTRNRGLEGVSSNTAEIAVSTLNMILALVSNIVTTQTCAGSMSRLRELAAELAPIATITANLRVKDGLRQIILTISYETWEKINDQHAMLVMHETAPMTIATFGEMSGRALSTGSLTGTVIEEL